MAGGSSAAAWWSGSSFGGQGIGAALVLHADDLLKQVEQLIAMAKKEKLSQRKTWKAQPIG